MTDPFKPRASPWADGTSLKGSNSTGDSNPTRTHTGSSSLQSTALLFGLKGRFCHSNPGLRPGLTQRAFQARIRQVTQIPYVPLLFGLKGRFCQFLSAQGEALVTFRIRQVTLIPHVPLVPLDLVASQPFAQLFLKHLLGVVLRLLTNIFAHRLHV
jgi:hypothetical protein